MYMISKLWWLTDYFLNLKQAFSALRTKASYNKHVEKRDQSMLTADYWFFLMHIKNFVSDTIIIIRAAMISQKAMISKIN